MGNLSMRSCVGVLSTSCCAEIPTEALTPEEVFFQQCERELQLQGVPFVRVATEIKKFSQHNYISLKALLAVLESFGFRKTRKNYRFISAFSEKNKD